MFGKRILILIPHPDDEVVGTAYAIARARADGARVFGAYLSHGCLPRQTLWPFQRPGYAGRVARRLGEADMAASFLGITVVDRNTTRAAREIWPSLPEAHAEMEQVLAGCAPDCVWVPAYEGGNPDHDAVNALASTISGIPVYEFSEYNLAGGRARANSFPEKNGGEIELRASREEQRIKRMALALYASERGNLSGLCTGVEQFRPLPRHDYAARPHPGRLWYERFQWVPFRHPRVDRTRAEQVSAVLCDFLKGVGAWRV